MVTYYGDNSYHDYMTTVAILNRIHEFAQQHILTHIYIQYDVGRKELDLSWA